MNKTATAFLFTLALCGTIAYFYLNVIFEENELDINLTDEEDSVYY